jgi:hypothetical protein
VRLLPLPLLLLQLAVQLDLVRLLLPPLLPLLLLLLETLTE